jgi:F0F1-type ATP synthase assembly protein I
MNKTYASALVLVWFGVSAVIYDFLEGVSDYDVAMSLLLGAGATWLPITIHAICFYHGESDK